MCAIVQRTTSGEAGAASSSFSRHASLRPKYFEHGQFLPVTTIEKTQECPTLIPNGVSHSNSK